MVGGFAQRDVNQPIALRVPDREALEGTLVEVCVYAYNDGAKRVLIRILFDLETFQRIEDEGLVGFAHGSAATDYRLLSTAAVELQLLPDPAALGELAGAPIEKLIDGLVSTLGASGSGPLQYAATYRWQSTMQEQALRPGITVSRGFGSVYKAG